MPAVINNGEMPEIFVVGGVLPNVLEECREHCLGVHIVGLNPSKQILSRLRAAGDCTIQYVVPLMAEPGTGPGLALWGCGRAHDIAWLSGEKTSVHTAGVFDEARRPAVNAISLRMDKLSVFSSSSVSISTLSAYNVSS